MMPGRQMVVTWHGCDASVKPRSRGEWAIGWSLDLDHESHLDHSGALRVSRR